LFYGIILCIAGNFLSFLVLSVESSMSSIKVPELHFNSHDWEKRIDVVKKFLALGSMRQVSEITNIPIVTLTKWRNEDWWDQLVAEVKTTQNAKVSNKIQAIIERALEVVEDRLENGDLVYNSKDGTLIRRPIPLRDVGKLTTELMNRKHQLDKSPVQSNLNTESVADKLKVIADEFKKWNRKTLKLEAEDIPFVEREDPTTNAVHEERKA
jgi:hypothetical protein